jgi:hypothetical protein
MAQSENESHELLPIPGHACQPVAKIIDFLHGDLALMLSDESMPLEETVSFFDVPNQISRLCGQLCVNGCQREQHFRAIELGIDLPELQERDELFDRVEQAFSYAIIASSLETSDSEIEQIVLPTADGAHLKEIISRRLNLLVEPEIAEVLVKLINRDNSNLPVTTDEIMAEFNGLITPVKDDETWEKLAEFCKGNVAMALSIFSYFQATFPYFRSDVPQDMQTARHIAKEYIMEDGSYRKVFAGFKPGNPYEISSVDIHKLASLLDRQGWLYLPTPGGYRCVYVTNNPEEYASWILNSDGTIDFEEGNSQTLPSIGKMRAIEARSQDTAE